MDRGSDIRRRGVKLALCGGGVLLVLRVAFDVGGDWRPARIKSSNQGKVMNCGYFYFGISHLMGFHLTAPAGAGGASQDRS